MTRSEKINTLYSTYLVLYANEDPKTYDLPDAVRYWQSLPDDELDMEIAEAEARLA
jgi:hypothetical protein